MASFRGIRWTRALLVVVGCGVAVASLAYRPKARDEAGRSPPAQREAAPAPSEADAAPRALSPIEQAWGIRPVSVRAASGGYLLAFRYRVVDAGKARALFDEKVKPVLVDRVSGASLSMPEDTKLGAVRSSPRTRPEDGKQYYVMFRNMTRSVTRGSRVDVVMGDCKMTDLAVE